MKKITLLFAAIALAFAAQAQDTYKVLKINKGTDIIYEIPLEDFDSITFETREVEVDPFNGHEYVDLGLPSGTLWATCNVGATKPEDYGDYFAWGETQPKENYSWSNEGDYKWGVYNSGDTNYGMTKYNKIDGKTVLDAEDDAAHVNWGGDWRMPTTAEQQELLNECTWEWTDNYNNTGVAGRIVTGTNGNAIFLPAAGCCGDWGLSRAGSVGYYWSSSLYESRPYDAWYLDFESSNQGAYRNGRYNGYSVRPVCSPNE